MFSATESVGTRLRDWNTKPTRRRRSTDSLRRLRPFRSVPARRTVPAVGASRPAAHCSRVDFPDPVIPMTAVSDPRGKRAETSRSAYTP